MKTKPSIPYSLFASLTLLCGGGVCLALSGCMGTSGLVRQLARDPATAYISVMHPYGQIKVIRTNPGTNVTVTVSPDGQINLDSKWHGPVVPSSVPEMP